MSNSCCQAKCISKHSPCSNCEYDTLPEYNGGSQINNKTILSGGYLLTLQRINKQVRQDSSMALFKKKAAVTSKQVGQSAHPAHLGQVGGPGNLIHSVHKGKRGVDKKHGSYARYLARRVGGELRKEKMPRVVGRTSIIKQPRNRTGTNSGVVQSSNIEHHTTLDKSRTIGGRSYFTNECCENRIPTLSFYNNPANASALTGRLGDNTSAHGGACN